MTLDTKTTAETGAKAPVPTKARRVSLGSLQQLTIVALWAALCVVSILHSNEPALWLGNLLKYAAGIGIVACGMTFVMVGGGFDLSVGSIVAVCGVTAVLMMKPLAGAAPLLAISVATAVTVCVGLVLGAMNGAVIARVGVNPFVVTLSSMFIFRGMGLVVTHGGQSQVVPQSLYKSYYKVYWGQVVVPGLYVPPWALTAAGVLVGMLLLVKLTRLRFRWPRLNLPAWTLALALLILGLLFALDYTKLGDAFTGLKIATPVLVFAAVFIASVYTLNFTRFGHYVYATGGNERASWLAGVSTKGVTLATYVVSGLVCAITGVILTALNCSAEASSAYQGMEMIVIASVIVGGTPLGGGQGGLFRTLAGLLLLCTIDKLLTDFGVGAQYRQIVTGLMIVTVVAVDTVVKRSNK